jgi:phospholipid/cholesterol/gamma-HCH transport system substrate-binding protein
MNPADSWYTTRLRLIGVVFLVVLGLLIWLSLALYNQQFTTVDMVTLHTSSVGNEMHQDAQVLVRGVQVGEVRSITANGSGATLTLAIQPGMVSDLPANMTAEMVPTTLFGERYVDLIPPAHPVAQRLGNGSVISQDNSKDAIELETVLNNLLPTLTAVQPQDLSLTLTALAQALSGRGTQLGQTLDTVNSYLQKFNPDLPALDNDIKQLVQVTQTYSQAAPNIVQALNDFAITSQTIVAQQQNLSALFTTVTQASQNLQDFLDQNQGNIIGLSTNGLPTLQILERYSSEFPCSLVNLANFVPYANTILGKGTNQPGLHATVHVTEPLGNAREPLGNYLPGVDTPKYGDNIGPHCYSISLSHPFTGITLNDGITPATSAGTTANDTAASSIQANDTAAGAVSPANSPEENELVNEIAGATLGVDPRSLPDWSSLLVGSLYRGRQVQLG